MYDTTKFNKLHPGGGSSIFINAGTDTTEEFEAIHSKRAWGQLAEWYIGDLVRLHAGSSPPSVADRVAFCLQDADAPVPPATPLETQALQRTSLDVEGRLKRSAARIWAGPVALDARKRQPFKCVAHAARARCQRCWTHAAFPAQAD